MAGSVLYSAVRISFSKQTSSSSCSRRRRGSWLSAKGIESDDDDDEEEEVDAIAKGSWMQRRSASMARVVMLPPNIVRAAIVAWDLLRCRLAVDIL